MSGTTYRDMPQLAEEQLESFDTEYVSDTRWEPIRRCIDRAYPDGHFTFLDVGGGVGLFADRVLDAYPSASGVVLDNSSLLLGRNKAHPRKELMFESVASLPRAVDQRFDIVFANWVLHHLVSPSYANTRRNIYTTLCALPALLSENGHISVYENLYKGIVIDRAPGRIIHRLTTSRAIARIARRQGANSAGVGVCFLSLAQWQKVFAGAGLQIDEFTADVPYPVPLKWKAFLHVGDIRCGHFWLRP